MYAAQLNDGNLVGPVIVTNTVHLNSSTRFLGLAKNIALWCPPHPHPTPTPPLLPNPFSQQSEMLINQLREITGIQDPETLYKALNVSSKP